MKRQTLGFFGVTMLVAAISATSISLASEPTKPATDAAKDAVKKGTDAAKDMAKQAQKSAEDAVKQATGGGAPEMSPEMMEGMKRWEEYSTPGAHHKHLEAWAGEWDLHLKYWMMPDMPPEENKLSATSKAIMGGRYIVEKVSGDIKGPDGVTPIPFEGVSTMGYDNYKKQFYSTWIDNMSTGMMMEWGTCDAAGKVITTEGQTYDPMVNTMIANKSVATVIDANSRRLEMFKPGPDGKMFKHMEITYTRKK